jgi:hypothetical protein
VFRFVPMGVVKKRFDLRVVSLLLYGGAFVGLIAWLVYLADVVPVVSRADFVFALWRLLPSLEKGELGGVLLGIFQIFGGHIVAYTRLFQIGNYFLFDYSPVAVKYAGLVTFSLAWASFVYLAGRAFQNHLPAAIVVLLGTVLICSPVTYGLISWPDAIVPYYSCFIVLSIGLPHVCHLLQRTGSQDLLWVALIGLAVICGSGVGWAVVPTFIFTALLASGYVDRLAQSRRWPLYFFISVVAILGAMLVVRLILLRFMTAYEDVFHLDEARSSLAGLLDNPGLALKFFFAVLATNILLGSVENTYRFGAIAFLFWLCLLLRCVAIRETKNFNIWISFALFGLLSSLLTAVARWHLMITHELTQASQYYSVFALPFHLGTLGLAIGLTRRDISQRMLRARVAGLVIIVTTASLFGFAALNLADRHGDYLRAAREGAALNEASMFGATNRNLLLLSEFAGVSGFAEMYLYGVLPDFKRIGKYPLLTAGYVEDIQAFVTEYRIPQPIPETTLQHERTERCLPRLGDARLAIAEPDRRRVWRWEKFDVGDNVFFRFAGYALNASDCNRGADFVFAVDRHGEIVCVSRPGPENARTLVERFQPPKKYHTAVFDFSCPIKRDELSYRSPFTVLAYSVADAQLAAIGFDDHPLDKLAITAKLAVLEGVENILVDGKPAKWLAERAGWVSANAGRQEGDFVILDGWALDRVRNRTAAAILVFAGEELLYAAPPTVPNPAAEGGAELAEDRRAGFRIALPADTVADRGIGALRIFALTEYSEVSELYYPPEFQNVPATKK